MDKSAIEGFPKALAARIADGQKHGVSDEMMVKGMVSLGNLFSHFVQPDSPEEALLSQIWDVATDDEKNMLASIVLRMGKQRLQ